MKFTGDEERYSKADWGNAGLVANASQILLLCITMTL